MASYVVLERRPVTGSRPDTVLVRDEFLLLALIFPLIWLLWHRLWFAALMLFLVSVGIGMTGEFIAPGAAMLFAGFAVSVLVALEGPAWRMARYRRQGYSDAGSVVARDLEDAEIRWFSGRGEASPQAERRVMKPANASPPPVPRESDMLFGFAAEKAR